MSKSSHSNTLSTVVPFSQKNHTSSSMNFSTTTRNRAYHSSEGSWQGIVRSMKHDRRNIMAMVCRCLVERGLLWCCLFEHMVCCCFCCFVAVTICLLCCYISIFYLYAGMVLWFLLYLRHHPYVKVKNCDGTAPFVLRFHVFTHTITTMVLNPLCTTHSSWVHQHPNDSILHWYGWVWSYVSFALLHSAPSQCVGRIIAMGHFLLVSPSPPPLHGL